MKLDFTKINFKDFDFHNTKTTRIIYAVFIIIVLMIDLLMFTSLRTQIKQSETRQKENGAEIKFADDLISKKKNAPNIKLISAGKMDDLTEKIYSIADKYGMEITLKGPLAKGKKGSFYIRRILSIDTSGSLKNLGAFLTELRNMPDAILNLRNMKLSSSANRVQAHLVFVLFTNQDNYENK